MISSLTGTLHQVDEDRIHLRIGPMVYEAMVPASDIALLQSGIGAEMTFHTILYLEGDASGANMEPRLVAFLRREDKKFFEKFITVKGIGPKKALKALELPTGEIEHAIEPKDAKLFCALPEIAKRTAEQIVAERSGKVADFATSIPESSASVLGGGRRTPVEEDAIMALAALGERRLGGEQLLDRVKQTSPATKTTQALIGEMLRMRTV